ncbi:MAG: acyltransferase [Thermodesulfobacteriota bacterium]
MNNVFIHPSAEVSKNSSIGKGTKIWNHVQIREGAKIGDNCIVGKDVYIDKGVKIGNNTKIQNGISLYNGIIIEDDVLLGPHCVFTNDLYPRSFIADYKIYPILIKRGASIGANATIVCGITIGKYAMIGAGSVVTKNVPDHGFVLGNPARLRGFVCHCGKRLKIMRRLDNHMILICEHCHEKLDISLLAIDAIVDIYQLEDD